MGRLFEKHDRLISWIWPKEAVDGYTMKWKRRKKSKLNICGVSHVYCNVHYHVCGEL